MKILYALTAILAATAASARAQSDLAGARWIGEPAYAIEEDGARIGFCSEPAAKEDEYQWVQLDLGEDRRFDKLRIHFARPHGDPTRPGELVPRALRVYTDRNERFDKSFMRIAENLEIDPAATEPLEFALSAYKLRYLRIVCTKLAPRPEGGHCFALGEIEVLDGGINIAGKAKISAGASRESEGWTRLAINDGELLPQPANALRARRMSQEPAVALRREFRLPAAPRSASLLVATRGMARTRINGVEVPGTGLGSGFFAADEVVWTSHDAKGLLAKGANCIGVLLAPGWHCGRGEFAAISTLPAVGIGLDPLPRYLARLVVECEDGSRHEIASDGKWSWSQAGAVRESDLLRGEATTTAANLGAWDKAGLDDTAWRPVASEPATGLALRRARAIGADARWVPAVLSLSPQAGQAVYDFGEVVVGGVSLRYASQPNMRLALRHALEADEEGRLSPAQGDGALDRLQASTKTQESWEPLFALHRFRHAQLTATEAWQPFQPPAMEEVRARAIAYDPVQLDAFQHASADVRAVAAELERRPEPAFDEVRRWLLRRHAGVELPDGGDAEWIVRATEHESVAVEWTQAGRTGSWSAKRAEGGLECVLVAPEGVRVVLEPTPGGATKVLVDGAEVVLEQGPEGAARLPLASGRRTIRLSPR
jgi:alpha-L-rhamnosidase